MTEKSILSVNDVQSLLNDRSPENRAAAAAKISTAFTSGDLSPGERVIAEDIFKIMVQDTEELVRRSLSQSLKDDPGVPVDVVKSLAGDVASVALPVIEFSDILSDGDLIEIIASRPEEHQVAIARRKKVSPTVSDALADTRNEDVVAALVANDGAEIGEQTFAKVLDDFGANEKINAPMARRKELPLKVTERLVTLVSEKMREHLVTHHAMSPDTAMDLVLQAREKAIVGMLGAGKSDQEVMGFVEELHRHKRLTPTIVLRALCMGDTIFFEASLATLAGVPPGNAYRLVHDDGDLGLRSLFEKCGLSPRMLEVARVALDTAEGLQLSTDDDRQHFQQLMIERVLTRFEDDFDTGSLDYFITKLGAENRHAA